MRRKLNERPCFTAESFHQSTLTMCKYMSWNRMFPLGCGKTFTTFKFLLKAVAKSDGAFQTRNKRCKPKLNKKEKSENHLSTNYTLQPP